jgi:superfamily II DNA/RNA helicase
MSIQKLLDDLSNIPMIGFTANPDRGDSLMVKFEKFIMPISKADAIEEGYISEPGINTVVDTGTVDKSKLAIDLVSKYRKHMGNTIVFFKTNKECETFFDWCESQGISAQILHTNSTEKNLDDALDNLSKGHIQFLINCKKVDEGIDVLNCTDVILARQFKTKSEKEQLIGRAIRPDTPCTVWEFQNPYYDSVEAIQVIGSCRFRRLLNIYKGEWEETLFDGFDADWGLASEKRFEYIQRNLGYDPRIETEEEALLRKSESGKKELENEIVPEGGFIVSHLGVIDKEKLDEQKVVEKKQQKITKRMLFNASDDETKKIFKTLNNQELKDLAKKLRKEGKI